MRFEDLPIGHYFLFTGTGATDRVYKKVSEQDYCFRDLEYIPAEFSWLDICETAPEQMDVEIMPLHLDNLPDENVPSLRNSFSGKPEEC